MILLWQYQKTRYRKETLSIFNSYNQNLQFTHALEHNSRISFLDVVLLIRNGNYIRIEWLRKLMSSDRWSKPFVTCHTNWSGGCIYPSGIKTEINRKGNANFTEKWLTCFVHESVYNIKSNRKAKEKKQRGFKIFFDALYWRYK